MFSIHIHLAFKLLLPDYDCFDKNVDYFSSEWERRKKFFIDYEMIYPRLISLMKWKFDCFFLFFEKRKKNKEKQQTMSINNALKNLCEKIIDVIWETFPKNIISLRFAYQKTETFT